MCADQYTQPTLVCQYGCQYRMLCQVKDRLSIVHHCGLPRQSASRPLPEPHIRLILDPATPFGLQKKHRPLSKPIPGPMIHISMDGGRVSHHRRPPHLFLPLPNVAFLA